MKLSLALALLLLSTVPSMPMASAATNEMEDNLPSLRGSAFAPKGNEAFIAPGPDAAVPSASFSQGDHAALPDPKEEANDTPKFSATRETGGDFEAKEDEHHASAIEDAPLAEPEGVDDRTVAGISVSSISDNKPTLRRVAHGPKKVVDDVVSSEKHHGKEGGVGTSKATLPNANAGHSSRHLFPFGIENFKGPQEAFDIFSTKSSSPLSKAGGGGGPPVTKGGPPVTGGPTTKGGPPRTTSNPTSQPTSAPTNGPTSQPTAGPTSQPTSSPTSKPTSSPTSQPTSGPTLSACAQQRFEDQGGDNPVPNSSFKSAVADYLAGGTAKENVRALYGYEINTWDVSQVTDMSNAFSGYDNDNEVETDGITFNEPLNCWDMSSVTNTAFMFFTAVAFNQPIGNWNMSSVTTTVRMFDDANVFNQPIGDWDMSSVTRTSTMFRSAHAFNQPIGN